MLWIIQVVDIIMIGETDLCLSMGYPLSPESPPDEVIRTVNRMGALAVRANKWVAGALKPSTGNGVQEMISRGISMIRVGLDAWMLRSAITEAITKATST